MLDKDFDKILKAKLEDLSLESPQANWSSFEEKYNAYLDEELDLAFDQSIKSKLEKPLDYAVDAGWAGFASKYEDVLNNDLDFDQNIKENVTAYKAPYNPSHWELLKLKLEHILHLRKSIYTSKALESVMVLLIAMTFINYFPTDKVIPVVKEDILTVAEFKDKKEASSPSIEANIIQEKISTKPDQTQGLNENNSSKDNISLESESLAGVSIIGQDDVNQSPTDQQITTLVNSPDDVKYSSRTFTAITDRITNESTDAGLMGAARKPIVKESNSINGFTTLPILSPNLDLGQEKLFSFDINSLEEEHIEIANSGIWFHTLVSTDLNFVNSEFGTPIGVENYKTTGTGYSAGIGLGYEFDKWAINSGFRFGSYSYVPETNEETYIRETPEGDIGEYVINLERIEHNTINVPIEVAYTITKKESPFAIYTSIGSRLNIINTTSYNIRNELINSFPNPGGVPIPWTNPDSFTAKEYVRGKAEGGTFSETASLYMTAGLGIQKSFGSGLALYLHPSYQVPVINDRISPNGDRINKLSIDVGLKFKLSQGRRLR